MFARIFAPALLTVAMLACSSELPLEAQRDHAQSRITRSNQLIWTDQTAPLSPGGSLTGATLTITSFSRDQLGILFASGTVEGMANGTAVSESYSGVFVQVYTTTPSCVEIRFDLGYMELSAVGTDTYADFGPVAVAKHDLSRELGDALCTLAKDRSADLTTINALIGA